LPFFNGALSVDDWSPFFGQFGKNCTMKPWKNMELPSTPRFKQKKQTRKPQKKTKNKSEKNPGFDLLLVFVLVILPVSVCFW
jgi:hypothetical protein